MKTDPRSQRNTAFQTAMEYARTNNLNMAQGWLVRADKYFPLSVPQVWKFKNLVGPAKFAAVAPRRLLTLDLSPEAYTGEERRTYV